MESNVNLIKLRIGGDLRVFCNGERERLFGSREQEGKLANHIPVLWKGNGN